MARLTRKLPGLAGLACGLVACIVVASAYGQGQQVYRYVAPDGRVVYSDHPPPPNAKDVQPKRMGGNFIEADAMPLAARQASERYPVTLYSFACGEICQSAEGLLNRRGIPFALVNVEDAEGAEELKRLTGETTAPVLKVGDKLVAKGFNEARWQALLDDAGYPKSIPPRRAAPPRAPAAAPARSEPQSAPVPGSGYPKE